jgi:hypothetical protein
MNEKNIEFPIAAILFLEYVLSAFFLEIHECGYQSISWSYNNQCDEPIRH